MQSLSILNNGLFSYTIVSPLDNRTLYTVTSECHSNGSWLSTIRRVSNDQHPDKPDTELASISYIDFGTTHVAFGARKFNLDAILRRPNIHSNSRIFVGPDNQTYKWKIHGRSLELRHADSHTLLARSHPQRDSLFLKDRPALLEVPQEHIVSDSPQFLDAVVVTYIIMQHKLQERTNYRYPF